MKILADCPDLFQSHPVQAYNLVVKLFTQKYSDRQAWANSVDPVQMPLYAGFD